MEVRSYGRNYLDCDQHHATRELKQPPGERTSPSETNDDVRRPDQTEATRRVSVNSWETACGAAGMRGACVLRDAVGSCGRGVRRFGAWGLTMIGRRSRGVSSRSFAIIVAGTVAVVSLGLWGTAEAVGAATSAPQYSGCLIYGQLFNLAPGPSPARSCPPGSTVVGWNQAGPSGPPGPSGLPGPSGPPGPRNPGPVFVPPGPVCPYGGFVDYPDPTPGGSTVPTPVYHCFPAPATFSGLPVPAGPQCPAGGVALVIGSPSPTPVVCNGVDGAPGASGAPGPSGPVGDAGPSGPSGATGPAGPPGPAGAMSWTITGDGTAAGGGSGTSTMSLPAGTVLAFDAAHATLSGDLSTCTTGFTLTFGWAEPGPINAPALTYQWTPATGGTWVTKDPGPISAPAHLSWSAKCTAEPGPIAVPAFTAQVQFSAAQTFN